MSRSAPTLLTRARLLVLATTLAIVMAALTAPEALAAPTHKASAATTGAVAYCTVAWDTSHIAQVANVSCDIGDNARDGYGPYVSWWTQYVGGGKLYNKSGANTNVTKKTRVVGHDVIGWFHWKVCREIPNKPDNCSKTISA